MLPYAPNKDSHHIVDLDANILEEVIVIICYIRKRQPWIVSQEQVCKEERPLGAWNVRVVGKEVAIKAAGGEDIESGLSKAKLINTSMPFLSSPSSFPVAPHVEITAHSIFDSL